MTRLAGGRPFRHRAGELPVEHRVGLARPSAPPRSRRCRGRRAARPASRPRPSRGPARRSPVVGAALGMADDDQLAAGIGDHFGRDVAGMGAGRLGMAVLAADHQRRARRPSPRPGRSASPAGRSRRRSVAPPIPALTASSSARLARRAVHLPVARDQLPRLGHAPLAPRIVLFVRPRRRSKSPGKDKGRDDRLARAAAAACHAIWRPCPSLPPDSPMTSALFSPARPRRR